MGHGIFPVYNHYYHAHEIFPYLSKAEKKEVFFPEKKVRKQNVSRLRFAGDDEEQSPKEHKKH